MTAKALHGAVIDFYVIVSNSALLLSCYFRPYWNEIELPSFKLIAKK